jgi:hypothetical protein
MRASIYWLDNWEASIYVYIILEILLLGSCEPIYANPLATLAMNMTDSII